jgi:hypothetical protein
MGIESLHPQFTKMLDTLIDCRNAFHGGRSIKAAGVRYLPILSGQTDPEYRAYKERALFFGITQKTVSAMVGMAMWKDPIIKYPERMAHYFEERQGSQFLEICSTTIGEVLLMGGYGLLVDAPEEGSILPVIARYTRENIINWIEDEDGNLTDVVLKEQVFERSLNDRFVLEAKDRWRHLSMSNGVYQVTVYDDKKAAVKTVVPTVKRTPLKFIPFFMINPIGVSMEMSIPPMQDIVDVNISHYRSSADLEHGRHFTGLPTPVVSGVEAGGAELKIGSETAWVLPNKDAKAVFLEFTGQGLQSLEKAMVEKQSQMASMSARLIDNSRRGSEAAETVKLRYMSETASLSTVVRATEDGLNLLYSTIADIMGEERPTITLNKQFMEGRIGAQDLTALINAYIEGGISKETLVYNLRRGDILSSKQDDTTELLAIKDPPPQGVGGTSTQQR